MTTPNKIEIDPAQWPERTRPNARAKPPYAYFPHPDDPIRLLPDPEVVAWVEKAMDYLDAGNSLRETAAWLSEKSGHPVSHQGLSNIWKRLRAKDKKNERAKKLRELKRKNAPKTKEEKEALALRRKRSAAKRNVTVYQKKLNQLAGTSEKAGESNGLTGTVSLDFEAVPKDVEVIFTPNPGPQTEFLAASEREVLYGGSAGGGKSMALLADPMRYFGHKEFNGLILRRTNDELRELIWKSQELYPKAFPGAKWSEKKSQWVFPSGARLWLTYLERDEDVLRYQGQAFCVAVGTPVLMADGSFRPVETLTEGDLVQTLEGPQTVQWKSDRQQKPLVKVTVYDAAGHQLCAQLQPDSHPIALLSSEPYSQLSDLCSSVGQFHSHPIQWLSEEHLRSLRQENRETSASQEGDQTCCTGSEDGPQEAQQPRGYFYPVVLASLGLPSGECQTTTQCRTCGISLPPLSEKCRDCSEILSGQQPHVERLQSQQGCSKPPACQFDGGEIYAQPETQTVQGSPTGCHTCDRLYGELPLEDLGDGQYAVRRQAGAEGPILVCLHDDETDCTPSRTRYQSSTYSHPYTQEQRDLAIPMELGIVHVEPYKNELSENVEVIDLTISNVNHYITLGGIVNRNCYIGIDELTQYATPFAWNYMRSRLRTTAEDLPLFMRATTNPGGPGHAWVKKMFIDPAPAKTTFAATDLDTGKTLVYPDGHEKAGQPLFMRKFIPASLYDNPHLMKDSNYEAGLLSLPEMQRRQLLEGDWTIAEGAAFPEFRHSVHVIDPFDIPADWRRFRSCDYGYSSYSAVHWFAIDPAFETLIVYRELYTTKRTGRELARDILHLEQGEVIQYGVLDSSCWHTRGQTGPSIAEEMIAEGCRWRPSDRSGGARVAGKNRLHELLRTNPETERPGIMFFNNCRQIIADLSVIPCDPRGSEDIDPRFQSDHSYDSVRYGIMSRPRAKSPFDFGPGGMRSSNWKPSDSVFGY